MSDSKKLFDVYEQITPLSDLSHMQCPSEMFHKTSVSQLRLCKVELEK